MQIDFPKARKFLAISIIWLLNTALSANDFESFLKPIFAQSCYKCHGGYKAICTSIFCSVCEGQRSHDQERIFSPDYRAGCSLLSLQITHFLLAPCTCIACTIICTRVTCMWNLIGTSLIHSFSLNTCSSLLWRVLSLNDNDECGGVCIICYRYGALHYTLLPKRKSHQY